MRESKNIMRVTSPTQIQYTIITDENSYTDTSFFCWALSLIRELPIDLMHLEDTLHNYGISIKAHINKSYEIFSLPNSFFEQPKEDLQYQFKSYSEQFNISLINVFIIDTRVKCHSNINMLIKELKHAYFIIDSTLLDSKYDNAQKFRGVLELIELFRRDLSLINQSISEHYGTSEIELSDLSINPSNSFLSENYSFGHPICANNYLMLNQAIGKYWIDTNPIDMPKTPPEKRIDELIESSKKIDVLNQIVRSEIDVKTVQPIDPFFSPLIIVAPYHYPKKNKSEKNKKNKLYSQFLLMEQDKKYQHYSDTVDFENKLSDSEKKILEITILQRLLFLDCAAFLHARFTFSPIIRVPQLGKSMNLDLSHINNTFSSLEKANKKISSIGDKLKEYLFDNNLSDYISNRNGQIFAISDLPIEWTKLKELPLCYSHDICRMPEFNNNALINSMIQNQRFTYTIPKDIIDHTLIIHCASHGDIPMQAMFKIIDDFADKISVRTVHCSTVNEIKESIQKHKPELLIFDCHGGFDPKTLSSYLILDGDKRTYLTGNDIVKNSISAPLVFLSACSTMPNYGYVKLLSDAFMEAGAYSVTTTFLPIQILDASVLIIRLISKLNQLKTKAYHSNWLELVSHVLRTTIIHESIKKAQGSIDQYKIDHSQIANILAKTMFFEKRIEALNDLNEILKEKFKGEEMTLERLNTDWMAYSIIGRADLLFFENWIEEFHQKNQ